MNACFIPWIRTLTNCHLDLQARKTRLAGMFQWSFVLKNTQLWKKVGPKQRTQPRWGCLVTHPVILTTKQMHSDLGEAFFSLLLSCHLLPCWIQVAVQKYTWDMTFASSSANKCKSATEITVCPSTVSKPWTYDKLKLCITFNIVGSLTSFPGKRSFHM